MKKWIERRQYIDKLLSFKGNDIIKVVTGLRRSGKSTLLELLRNRLLKDGVMPEQIQFYNFEFPRAHSPLLCGGVSEQKIKEYQLGIEDSSRLAARSFNCPKTF